MTRQIFWRKKDFTIIIPDFFWRTAPLIQLGYTEQDFQKSFQSLSNYDENLGEDDIQDTLNFLKRVVSSDADIGLEIVGCCLGDKAAYLAGHRIPEFTCAVGYYGVGIE